MYTVVTSRYKGLRVVKISAEKIMVVGVYRFNSNRMIVKVTVRKDVHVQGGKIGYGHVQR